MKTVGIVAEYNPFHNGHKYHIEETRKQTGADYVIAIMSGDFVQRGAPAIMDKYDRAHCALSGGCDLVLELPVIYSTSSAEFFATGAVLGLDKLGVCNYLSFGSEAGHLNELSLLADVLLEEPAPLKELLRNHLKDGLSFPLARALALKEYFADVPNCQLSNNFLENLSGSNNILGLEYLKAIKKSKTKLTPITVERKNASYHDKKLHQNISSATAIRDSLLQNQPISAIMSSVPEETYSYLTKNHPFHRWPDFSQLTPYLHGALLNKPDPASIVDWDQDLSNRIERISWSTLDFHGITEALKSRHMTQTRIQRALLHLILQMEKADFEEQYNRNPVPYLRILGFRKESSSLLKAIKKNSSIPVITKPATVTKLTAPEDSWVVQMDYKAATLYQSIVFQSSGVMLPSPYARTPVIL